MRGFRKRKTQAPPQQEQTNTNPLINHVDEPPPKISQYEQSREERIKANQQRMQQLGLSDLSHKLLSPPKRALRNNNNNNNKFSSPLPPSGPLRRSSRLQNGTPVSYSEAALAKKDGLDDDMGLIEVGCRPEVYTEEHERLLGNTERSWELFVDGYGSDGRRIYDQVKGKTCHQCRQKTLGFRTHCSKCQMVQGQFCGDCLYIRYGEHVLEAIENPNWICPVCRGICNCSLCRTAKGWRPTGSLYRKISNMGYKSVAHYLIQTRQSQYNVNQVSVKRALPFADTETPLNESPQVDNNQVRPLILESKDKVNDEFRSERGEEMLFGVNFTADGQVRRSVPLLGGELQSEDMESTEFNNEVQDDLGSSISKIEDKAEKEFEAAEGKGLHAKDKKQMLSSGNSTANGQTSRALLILGCESQLKNMESAEVNNEVQDDPGVLKSKIEDKLEKELRVEEEKGSHFMDKRHDGSNIAMDDCSKLKRKHKLPVEQSQDSIASRLRRRHSKCGDHNDADLTGVNEKYSNVKLAANDMFSTQEVDKGKEMHIGDTKNADITITLEGSPMLKKNPAYNTEPKTDSIGARLQQRRKMEKGRDDELLKTNEETSDVGQTCNIITFFKQEVDKAKEMLIEEDKNAGSSAALEGSTKLKKKPAYNTINSDDSIGTRLRQRHRMSEGHYDDKLPGTNEKTSGCGKKVYDNCSSMKELEASMKLTTNTKSSEDSIARRLRPRHKTA